MKKITLLVASILLLGNVAKASDVKKFDEGNGRNEYNIDEPIVFTERGIEFFVFANGDFDFNTRPDDTQGGYYFKSAGKKGAADNATSRGGRGPVNYGVIVEQDSFGRVRRVGNTFINYDFNDRVSRIGSVFMRYNRFALTQVGGLRIVYNRFGEITDMIGCVKGRASGYTNNYYGNNYDNHNHNGYHNNEYHNNTYATNYNSNDYYYYKADGTRAKVEEKN